MIYATQSSYARMLQPSYQHSSISDSLDSVVSLYAREAPVAFQSQPQISQLEQNVMQTPSQSAASHQPAYTNQVYQAIQTMYQKIATYSQHYATPKQQNYHVVDNFLHIYRPQTQFIGSAQEIKEHIESAFLATTGDELPQDIQITICSKEELKRIHSNFSSNWSEGIQGFSLNKTRQVFVKEGDLDRVMLVVGHEIGHVLSPSLANKHDEEAKAFAFELAWMQAIVEHNIANLKDNINLDFKPANNGLHDIAFGFVRKVFTQGKRALQIFNDLITGDIAVKETLNLE